MGHTATDLGMGAHSSDLSSGGEITMSGVTLFIYLPTDNFPAHAWEVGLLEMDYR